MKKKKLIPRVNLYSVGDWWCASFSIRITDRKTGDVRKRILRRKVSRNYEEALIVKGILENVEQLAVHEMALIHNVIQLRLPLKEILSGVRHLGKECVYTISIYATDIMPCGDWTDLKRRLMFDVVEAFCNNGIRPTNILVRKEFVKTDRSSVQNEDERIVLLKRRSKKLREGIKTYLAKSGIDIKKFMPEHEEDDMEQDNEKEDNNEPGLQ